MIYLLFMEVVANFNSVATSTSTSVPTVPTVPTVTIFNFSDKHINVLVFISKISDDCDSLAISVEKFRALYDILHKFFRKNIKVKVETRYYRENMTLAVTDKSTECYINSVSGAELIHDNIHLLVYQRKTVDNDLFGLTPDWGEQYHLYDFTDEDNRNVFRLEIITPMESTEIANTRSVEWCLNNAKSLSFRLFVNAKPDIFKWSQYLSIMGITK